MASTHHNAHTPVITEHDVDQPRSRISLAAVVGGAVLALMVMLLLNLLTLGIGLRTIDPATEANPFAGTGMGTLIGVLIANLVALFAGGWVAGRLANKPRGADASLHGILTWALTTLLSFWLLSTAAGQLVSGVTGAIGQGLSAVGQGISSVAPDAAQAVEDALANRGVSVQSIRQEAQDLANTDSGQGGTVAGLAERFFTQDGQVDRQELVDALVANTNLTEAEAESRVDTWEQQYQQTVQAVEQARQDLEQAAQQASDAVGSAAIWAFIGLLIGAGVAVMGSLTGRPKNLAEARAG